MSGWSEPREQPWGVSAGGALAWVLVHLWPVAIVVVGIVIGRG